MAKGKLPSVRIAMIPVLALLLLMSLAILVFKQDPHIPLLLASVVTAVIARKQGYSWQDLEVGLLKGIEVGLKAVLILMVIGILIAVWIASGVGPYLIYLGLELLHPSVFLLATCLICAVVSLSTGSSWTTAGTVGVALMGVGAGLDLPLAMVAGAVVSGAYFGDKMSPLSDSTNLAPAVNGVDLFVHIRHMFGTTFPAFGIALLLYALTGLFLSPGPTEAGNVESIQVALASTYHLSPLLLLAPLTVVVLSLRRFSALPVLAASAGVGAVLAVALQGVGPGEIVGIAHYGFVSETGHGEVDALLSGGGLDAMMFAVSLILCALAFGGIMERSRMMESLAEAILSRVRNRGDLTGATVLTCVGLNVTVPDQYLAIILPGRMYQSAYQRMKLHPKNLSRTVEDAGTMTSPLIPWNTCGATMMVVLGVSPFVYLPYAFFNLLTPIVAILWSYLGVFQAELESHSPASSRESCLDSEGSP
ncbi:MAG: Na+/H+ antiporter NhaC [Opitutales bacterium]|nr:Na+/H+ antiporter NhaC [Opitutales bacterium]